MRATLQHLTHLTSLSLRFAPIPHSQDHILEGVQLPRLERFRYAAYIVNQSLLAAFLCFHGNTLLQLALDADVWISTRYGETSRALEPELVKIQLPLLRSWVGPLLLALSIHRSSTIPLEAVVFTRCSLSHSLPTTSGRLGTQINAALAFLGSPKYLLVVHHYSTVEIVELLDEKLLPDLRTLRLRYQPDVCGKRLAVSDHFLLGVCIAYPPCHIQFKDIEGWAEDLVEQLHKFPNLEAFDTDAGYERPLYEVAEEGAFALLASGDIDVVQIGMWTYECL